MFIYFWEALSFQNKLNMGICLMFWVFGWSCKFLLLDLVSTPTSVVYSWGMETHWPQRSVSLFSELVLNNILSIQWNKGYIISNKVPGFWVVDHLLVCFSKSVNDSWAIRMKYLAQEFWWLYKFPKEFNPVLTNVHMESFSILLSSDTLSCVLWEFCWV